MNGKLLVLGLLLFCSFTQVHAYGAKYAFHCMMSVSCDCLEPVLVVDAVTKQVAPIRLSGQVCSGKSKTESNGSILFKINEVLENGRRLSDVEYRLVSSKNIYNGGIKGNRHSPWPKFRTGEIVLENVESDDTQTYYCIRVEDIPNRAWKKSILKILLPETKAAKCSSVF